MLCAVTSLAFSGRECTAHCLNSRPRQQATEKLACVAGRRAREGKGGIGFGGEEEGTHAHPSRVTLTRFAHFPFPSPSTPATQATEKF